MLCIFVDEPPTRMRGFFFFFFICSFAFAQERITDFDSLTRSASKPVLNYLRSEGKNIYFKEFNRTIYRYDLAADSLLKLDDLPVQGDLITVQNGEIYAFKYLQEGFHAYHFDRSKGKFSRVSWPNLGENQNVFITESSTLLYRDKVLLRIVFKGAAAPSIDTISTSASARHLYLIDFFLTHHDGQYALWDRKGKEHSLAFPELKDILDVDSEQNGGWIVKVKSTNGASVYRVQGDKIELLLGAESTEGKYYRLGDKTVQVSYRMEGNKKVEMTLREFKDGKAKEIGRHALNVYSNFHAVITAAAYGPSSIPYGNELEQDGKLYFLGNEALNMTGTPSVSNLQLFCVDLRNNTVKIIDANALLHKDLFRTSNYMARGGYYLQSQGEDIVVYPLVSSSEKHKKYVLREGALVPFSTVYDPRYFVETPQGFLNVNDGILLDSSLTTARVLKYPVQVKAERKVGINSGLDPFGSIIHSDEYLYILNVERERPQLSTLDHRLRKHTILQNFREASFLDTLSLPGKRGRLIAFSGDPDTLSVRGHFIYYHDFATDQFSYLGHSYKTGGFRKAKIRERKGRFEIIGLNYLLYTDLVNSQLIDDIAVIKEDEGGVLAIADKKLVRIVDGQKSVLLSGVSLAYPMGDDIFLSLNSGVAMWTKNGYSEWMDGFTGFRTVNVLSDKEVFFQFNERFYLLNTESGRWKDLNVPTDYYPSYTAFKVPLGTVIAFSNTKGSGYYFHNGRRIVSNDSYNHQSGRIYYYGQLYKFSEKYDIPNRRMIYTVSTWEGEYFKRNFSFAMNSAPNFSHPGELFVKSLEDGKIYLWTSAGFTLTSPVFHKYEKVEVVEKGRYLATLADGSAEFLEEAEQGIRVQMTGLLGETRVLMKDHAALYIHPSGIIHTQKPEASETEVWFTPSPAYKISSFRNHFVFKGSVYTLGLAQATGWQMYRIVKTTEDQETVLHMYPNPVIDVLHVQSNVLKVEDYVLTIRDSGGSLVKEVPVRLPAKVDVVNIKPGLYYLNLQGNGVQKSWRMVKL